MAGAKYIGARVQRLEDPKFIRGRARYVGDLQRVNMVHLCFVRSRHAHARIRGIDLSRARSAPGVVGIWTGADTRERLGLMTPLINSELATTFKISPMPPMAFDKVRLVGDVVAVVAAEDRYLAEDAVDLIDVDYEPLEAVVDAEEAMRPGAPLVWDEWGDNIMDVGRNQTGDVDAAFARAAVVVRQRFRTGRHQATPLEGRGCLAEPDDALGDLTLWTSTQVPHVVRTQVANALGFPDHRLTVIAPDVGGGFGLKAHVFREEILTCWVALQLGRPVRWLEDRTEAFTASFQAKEEIVDAELAVDAQGTILGLKARVVGNAGAYSACPWPGTYEPMQLATLIPGPYDVRAYRFEAYTVVTNKPPLSPFRGVGGEIAAMATDHLIALAARQLGKDPAELFRRNILRKDQLPYVSAAGQEYDAGDYAACLERALTHIEYERLRREHAELRRRGCYRGVGICSYTEQTGYGSRFLMSIAVNASSYESAHLRMDPGGQLTVMMGTHSHGQGQHTAFAQVAAEHLGIPLADVKVVLGDTSKTPFGWGTWGSRSTVTGGGALINACGRLAEKIKRVAAHLMEVGVQDIELEGGIASVRGVPSQRMTIKEIARAVVYNKAGLLPEGEDAGLEATASYDPPKLSFSNATHAAEVEVDRDTGLVRILKYVVVEDCGTMINPMIVDGQIQGGVAQGIGGALFEEIPYDDSGQPLATSFMDYLLPTSCDVPHMIVDHLETPSTMVPGGFKGMGEGGTIGAPGAIVNAISDALGGVAIGQVPLTPERVRELARAAT